MDKIEELDVKIMNSNYEEIRSNLEFYILDIIYILKDLDYRISKLEKGE